MSRVIENKLAGRERHKNTTLTFLFNPKTIISLVLIGIFSFASLIALSGYAGDLRKDRSGQPTATSRSAVGYAGYVQLLKDMGYEVNLPANLAAPKRLWETRPLRIYSLTNSYQSETLKKIPEKEAKLIILPKWQIITKADKIGWVDTPLKNQTFTSDSLSELLKDADINLSLEHADKSEMGTDYAITFAQLDLSDFTDTDEDYEPLNYDSFAINSRIDYLQSFIITDENTPYDIILTADQRPVIIRLQDTQTYILSEPDLLNTQGISNQSRARLAVNILDVIAEYENLTYGAVDFDLSIHGLGGGRNIIKLMTLPPFLAATLCLLAAGGIVAWQAFSRFGDPLRREPDFAQGPVSLAKSAAEFMSVAGRVQHMAPDYAQLTRQQVIRNMGLIGQSQDHIDRAITARETQRKINPTFSDLTVISESGTENFPKTLDLIEHARAMTRWKEEMMS